jgi:5-methylcytosine-specific restriction endonuclease McrA
MIERVISPEIAIGSFGLISIALAFSRELKEKIREEQKGFCADCGLKPKKLEIHHIIPQSMGGPDTEDNAVGLCPNCHQEWDERAKKGKFFKKKK